MADKIKLSRRRFIYSSAAFGLLPRVSKLFARTVKHAPYPKAVLSSEKKDFSLELDVISGSLPKDIYGHAFLLEGMSDESNIYVKSGKGAINRLDFESSKVLWTRALIKTPSVLMAEAVTSTKYKFEAMAKMLYQSKKLGFMNTSNTNAVPIGDGRLVLSFEGGRHWEICPKDLKLITPVGELSKWKSALTGIPGYFNRNLLFPSIRTTAHPYYDKKTKSFITINYGSKVRIKPLSLGRPFTRVCVWDRNKEFKSWNVICAKTGKNVEIMNTSHSFLVTRNYIGIVDTPANVEAEIFIGIAKTRASVPYTKIWWLQRSSLSSDNKNVPALEQTIKREFIDLVCDFNDTDGIRIYSGSIQSSDQTEFLRKGDELFVGGTAREELLGLSSGPNDLSGFIKLDVDLDFEALSLSSKEAFFADDADLWGIDFPAYRGNYAFPDKFKHMYWSTVGYNPDQILKRLVKLYSNQKYRNISTEYLPKTNHGASIVHLDCEGFEIASKYVFPVNCAIGALQFIPKRKQTGQDEGYLLSVVSMSSGFNPKVSSGQEVWIFDAKDLSAGPLCRLGHKELDVAYTLHSSWLEKIIKRDTKLATVDLIKEAQELLMKQDSNIVKLYKSIINKHFKRG